MATRKRLRGKGGRFLPVRKPRSITPPKRRSTTRKATTMAVRTRNVGSGTIKKLQDRLATAQRRTASVRKQAGAFVESAVRTAEICGVAFALGYFQGKKGGWEIMGVPMELALGLVSHAAALAGIGMGAAEHVRAIGDGSLAAYMTTYGRGMGRESAAKEAKPSTKGYEVGGYEVGGYEVDQVAPVAAVAAPAAVVAPAAAPAADVPPGYFTMEDLAALADAI